MVLGPSTNHHIGHIAPVDVTICAVPQTSQAEEFRCRGAKFSEFGTKNVYISTMYPDVAQITLCGIDSAGFFANIAWEVDTAFWHDLKFSTLYQ